VTRGKWAKRVEMRGGMGTVKDGMDSEGGTVGCAVSSRVAGGMHGSLLLRDVGGRWERSARANVPNVDGLDRLDGSLSDRWNGQIGDPFNSIK
jgi:hypothetical protein